VVFFTVVLFAFHVGSFNNFWALLTHTLARPNFLLWVNCFAVGQFFSLGQFFALGQLFILGPFFYLGKFFNLGKFLF
jgi:hypothetical protein